MTEWVFPKCYCDFSSAVSKKLFRVAKVVCFKDILRVLEALNLCSCKRVICSPIDELN
jgi:hypothetical protein